MRNSGPFNTTVLLWWVAIISLVVSAVVFVLLTEQARIDDAVRARRLMFPLVGVIIAGICLIAGTAGRWFDQNSR